MDTLDPMTGASSAALHSPAAERNTAPLLAVLRAHLPARGGVLEIASGTGQHALAFATALPETDWTPTDPSEQARASIAAYTVSGPPNLKPALALDAADPATWPTGPFDTVVCINMIHISPWTATQGLMAGAGSVLDNPGGLLVLYGPYVEADVPVAPSNAAFDADLRNRDPAWGLRDRDDVVTLAKAHGLHLTHRAEMPANNIVLLFRRA